MAQSLNIKIAGLYSYPSDLSAVPPGALTEASNIVLDRDSIAAPRRGYDYLAHGSKVQSQFSDPTYRANQLFNYQTYTLCHYGPSSVAYHDPTTGWVNYSGTFLPPSATVRARSAQANKNFYFTTSKGVMKLDKFNGTPTPVGVPPGLDVTTSLTSSFTATGTTTSGSNVVTSVSTTTNMAIGLQVTGTGIPANTLVTSFTSNTVTLNNNASASGSPTLTFQSSNSWFAASTATAYRVLWSITDANQNLVRGAVSASSSITNTTASATSVNVNFTIPAGITTSHVYKVYRSAAVAAGATPNDEGQLVYQSSPLASDISAGFVTVNDVTPDALRGETIYTAASQEGLVNTNVVPPFAYDLAVFRDCMFYGNTSGLQTYFVSLLGVGAPSGIVVGDTITIGGVAFTAGSSENTSTGQFLVTNAFLLTTTGTTSNGSPTITSTGSTTGVTVGMAVSGTNIPAGTFVTNISGSTVTMSQNATGTNTSITFTGDSAAQAIRDTALSLVKVINRYASSTVYAQYTSTSTGLPGQITIQSRTVGANAFVVIASRSSCWSPALPTSGTTQQSTNQANKNYLYYSKQFQPEAVPLGNYIPIGSADKAILRILPLRDSLFILKEDGTFLLTGTDPSNFLVRPLDYTAILIAPESARVLNNQIWCLTTQGVVALSEVGAPIMSHPIEGELSSLITQNYSLLQTSTFGVAYESDRAYHLFCITNAADTSPTQYYRFNYVTNSWTHGTLAKTCGAVNPVDNRLYLGNANLNIVDVERKDLTDYDYADYQSTQTISAINGKVLTITASDTIQPGYVIWQSATVFGIVLSVNTGAGTVTTTLATDLVTGAADVLAPPDCRMTWAPVTFDNPGYSKQVREATLLFLSEFNGQGTVAFKTDLAPAEGTEVIPGGSVGGWGLSAWGGTGDVTSGGAQNALGVPWGGDPRRREVRVSVDRNHQRAAILTVSFRHAYAFSRWQLQGVSLIGNLVSERVVN